MSSTTTNLSLTKPAGGENINLSVLNGNWDKIDAAAGRTYYNIAKDSSFNAGTFAINVFKFNKFAIVYYNIGVPSITASTTVTMAHISSACTPSIKTNYTICGQSGGMFLMSIDTNGDVTIYSANPSSQFIRGSAVIPIA